MARPKPDPAAEKKHAISVWVEADLLAAIDAERARLERATPGKVVHRSEVLRDCCRKQLMGARPRRP